MTHAVLIVSRISIFLLTHSISTFKWNFWKNRVIKTFKYGQVFYSKSNPTSIMDGCSFSRVLIYSFQCSFETSA